MRRTFRILIAIYVMVIIAIAACKKTEKTTNTIVTPVTTYNYGTDKTQLNQLFSAIRPVAQTFSVAAGTTQTIIAAGGTKLTFYPTSFKNASGSVISSGTINIAITELLKPGDMIANRAATTCNGQLLLSGGEVNIKATMGGQEVFANKYGLTFKRPSYSSQPMLLYYGNTNNADSVTTWSLADTTAQGLTAPATVIDSDSTGTVFNYTFDSCTSFNWINCDHFYTFSPLTNITVNATDTTFNASNTEVFIVFPTINSVVSAEQYTPATHTFSLYGGYIIPVGYTVDLVVISNVGGSYYYYQELGVTVTAGMAFHPVMAPHTLSYIHTALAAL